MKVYVGRSRWTDELGVKAEDLEHGAYRYQGEQTCAADGLCAVACPVDINTGEHTKALRRLSTRPAARQAAKSSSVGSPIHGIELYSPWMTATRRTAPPAAIQIHRGCEQIIYAIFQRNNHPSLSSAQHHDKPFMTNEHFRQQAIFSNSFIIPH